MPVVPPSVVRAMIFIWRIIAQDSLSFVESTFAAEVENVPVLLAVEMPNSTRSEFVVIHEFMSAADATALMTTPPLPRMLTHGTLVLSAFVAVPRIWRMMSDFIFVADQRFSSLRLASTMSISVLNASFFDAIAALRTQCSRIGMLALASASSLPSVTPSS